MFGTIVNVLAIIAGSLVGILCRDGIPERYNKTIIHAISLSVILIGISSALKTDRILVVIFSMAIGSAMGEMLNIELKLEQLGKWVENRLGEKGSGFTRGFVTASLIFCVGAMAIVGSMESGLSGNHQTLFAKSVLDGVTSIIFASTFGIGVLFSAVSVLVYQGTITLGASLIKPFLVPAVVQQMSAVGGLLIFAIGINMLEMTKIKIGNMLPAIFMPLLYYILKQMLKI